MTDPFQIPKRNPADYELDYEGCQKNHCHAGRSLSNDDNITEDGKRKVCHKPSGWGTNHNGEGNCSHHGGSTPGHIKGIERARARQAVRTYGLPLNVDPQEGLLIEVQRSAGHCAWLGAMVASHAPEDLVYGMVEETVNTDTHDPSGVSPEVKGVYRAAPNTWLKLYNEERKHFVAVCKAAVDAGVSVRLVTVFESVATVFTGMFDDVLNELDLTPEQRDKVPAAMLRQLDVIEGKIINS